MGIGKAVTTQLKSFKQYVIEEWIDDSPSSGAVYRNPKPKELSEYLQSVGRHNVAGVLKGNKDIWVFSKNLHDNFMRKYGSSYGLTDTNSFPWRAVKVGSRKLSDLAPGGDPSVIMRKYKLGTSAGREYMFEQLVKVMKHSSMKNVFEKPELTLDYVSWDYFGTDSEAKQQYVHLMKKHFGLDVPEPQA